MHLSNYFVIIILIKSVFFIPAAKCDSLGLAPNWGPWTEAKSLFDAQKYEDALRMLQSQPRYEGAYYF
ncbi:MAG: hypothetical protein AABZ55_02535, partial [Bdellovibrionota bacterium]